MTITAKIIADSIARDCPRVTTMQLRFPRFILPEFNTHRAFSRNASSSRAIPIERMIDDIVNDTAMPVMWGSNKPGMQSGHEVDKPWYCAEIWRDARDAAIIEARRLAKAGVHKQHVNRLIEPYMHVNVLVTSTEWDNFFTLRDHEDAQPEIRALAIAMRESIADSVPVQLEDDDWHMPYVTEEEKLAHGHHIAAKISAARCASVSYKTVDGQHMTVDKALSICEKLMSDPLHASPFEHIAKPCHSYNKSMTRNFTGWAQYRAFLESVND